MDMENKAPVDTQQQQMTGETKGKAVNKGILNANSTSKRESYLKWDDYFMSIAFLSAQRSKDPSTQVGACIVNNERKIVGIGYNGMPNGCNDDVVPWGREAMSQLDTKYPYVVHAEVNAVLNKNTADVKNCTIYVALFPCNECAKVIIQSGIREVIYFSDKNRDKDDNIASRKLFDWAKVKYTQFVPSVPRVEIDFAELHASFSSKAEAQKPLAEKNVTS